MKALTLTLALALVPLAAAYPNHAYPCDVHPPFGMVDGACVGDAQYGAGCGEPGEYDGVTGAAVMFDSRYFLDVGGFELCDTSESGERRVHGVYVETATVTYAWSYEECSGDAPCDVEGCSMWLWVGPRASRAACPDEAAPPNPGWGRILP